MPGRRESSQESSASVSHGPQDVFLPETHYHSEYALIGLVCVTSASLSIKKIDIF